MSVAKTADLILLVSEWCLNIHRAQQLIPSRRNEVGGAEEVIGD